MVQNLHQLRINEQLNKIVNAQIKFNKPLAVVPVANTKTLISSPTASLSTKTITNEPALSDITMVTPDPPFVSNETTATDNQMIQYHLVTMVS